jgi:hypothetical protein
MSTRKQTDRQRINLYRSTASNSLAGHYATPVPTAVVATQAVYADLKDTILPDRGHAVVNLTEIAAPP